MKAITIHQPWASLIACGAKKYETRRWKTNYRGKIAIHAGLLKNNTLKIAYAFGDNGFLERVRECVKETKLDRLPYGAIIATAELIQCWRIVYNPGTNIDIAKHIPIGGEIDNVDKHHPDFAKYIVPTEQELLFGDWTPGRYAWELANVKILDKPILAKGKQRLWEWEGEIDG